LINAKSKRGNSAENTYNNIFECPCLPIYQESQNLKNMRLQYGIIGRSLSVPASLLAKDQLLKPSLVEGEDGYALLAPAKNSDDKSSYYTIKLTHNPSDGSPLIIDLCKDPLSPQLGDYTLVFNIVPYLNQMWVDEKIMIAATTAPTSSTINIFIILDLIFDAQNTANYKGPDGINTPVQLRNGTVYVTSQSSDPKTPSAFTEYYLIPVEVAQMLHGIYLFPQKFSSDLFISKSSLLQALGVNLSLPDGVKLSPENPLLFSPAVVTSIFNE
jgi:hypothetical protein